MERAASSPHNPTLYNLSKFQSMDVFEVVYNTVETMTLYLKQ